MAVDSQNDWKQGDLQYTILRKILSRLPFISGGGGGGGGTLSTDQTLGGATPSDALYPSQRAAKVYIDNGLATKQNSLGFTPENVANKATNLTAPDNVKYPSTLAVSTALAGKQDSLGFTPENVANKATDFSTLNNTLYPTTQAVANYISTVAGAYVLKAGDTMTGRLQISMDSPGDPPFSDITITHLLLNNTQAGAQDTKIMFTNAGVVQGGLRANEAGIFQFFSNQVYFSTNIAVTPALNFYCDFDGTLANTTFSGGYARLNYWLQYGGSTPHGTVGGVILYADEDDGPGRIFAQSTSGRITQLGTDFRNYGVGNPSTSYERIGLQWDGTDYQLFMESDSAATLRDIVFGIGVTASVPELIRLRGNNGDSTVDSIGFFGATPVPQQSVPPATAGALYTATEQAMLQAVYDALRAFGLGA